MAYACWLYYDNDMMDLMDKSFSKYQYFKTKLLHFLTNNNIVSTFVIFKNLFNEIFFRYFHFISQFFTNIKIVCMAAILFFFYFYFYFLNKLHFIKYYHCTIYLQNMHFEKYKYVFLG